MQYRIHFSVICALHDNVYLKIIPHRRLTNLLFYKWLKRATSTNFSLILTLTHLCIFKKQKYLIKLYTYKKNFLFLILVFVFGEKCNSFTWSGDINDGLEEKPEFAS